MIKRRPAGKARPSFTSLAKQIDALTPKTRREERGFDYEMRNLKALMRCELRLVRAEAATHVRGFKLALAGLVRRLGRRTAA